LSEFWTGYPGWLVPFEFTLRVTTDLRSFESPATDTMAETPTWPQRRRLRAHLGDIVFGKHSEDIDGRSLVLSKSATLPAEKPQEL
jgi:hypothetical protein